MKEKIFIAWSGSTLYAEKVHEMLTHLGYSAIIGGNISENPNSLFVGASIINQMRQCTQAIILMQRKADTNNISANIMFEFGYLLAMLGSNKIYTFFIDIEENDKAIPSDIKNIWAKFLPSGDDLASKVVDAFMTRQRQPIAINKTDIITKWYRYKSIIETYPTDPVCSNYEMAQYLIFYIQAIYFYKDYDSERLILQMCENSHEYSEELQCSLCAVRTTLSFYSVFHSQSNAVISDEMFDRLEDEYEDLIERIEELEEGEFKDWIIAIVEENAGFLHYYYLLFAELDPEEKCSLYDAMLEHTERAVELFGTIENNTRSLANDAYFLYLFKAYLYRQEAVAYRYIYEHRKDEMYLEKCRQRYDDAFKMRRKLFLQYMNPTENNMVADSIELEYYMSMAELLEFIESQAKRNKYISQLKRYIIKAETGDTALREALAIIRKSISDGC